MSGQALVIAAAIREQLKLIPSEPNPLLAVLTLGDSFGRLSEAELGRLREAWELLWKGAPPFPMVVIPPGADLSVIVDPRAERPVTP